MALPGSVFDERQLESDPVWSRGAVRGVMAALLGNNLDYAAPLLAAANVTLGAAAGTSPSALAVTAGSNQLRGQITFTAGSATPAGGTLATVLFPVPLTGALHAGTTTPWLYVAVNWSVLLSTTVTVPALSAVATYSGSTVTGFVVYVGGTVAASQAVGFNYSCSG
jgi:hypothetical protein